MTTRQTILIGFFLACVACFPTYQWVFHNQASVFPLGWVGTGLHYMAVFFHEIGHTITAWFYGYPTLPMFDFKYGGGMAYSFGGTQMAIVVCIWAALAYGIYFFRNYTLLVIPLVFLLLLNLATFWHESFRLTMVDFMGAGFEALIACFFLFRAVFNLAPRGNGERILNAAFGFGLIFKIFINGYGLLYNQAHRLTYYTQKGQHGFGDFDKIADRFTHISFDMVVYGWLGLAIICLLSPFITRIFTD